MSWRNACRSASKDEAYRCLRIFEAAFNNDELGPRLVSTGMSLLLRFTELDLLLAINGDRHRHIAVRLRSFHGANRSPATPRRSKSTIPE